ncbi:PCRF domain-containing protein, partial [Klebsiella pneumoniae]
IESLRLTFANIVAVTHPDQLREQIADLSKQAAAPDLWDDPEKAQQVTSSLSHVQSELARVTKMGERIDDLEAIVELAGEEEGEDRELLLEEAAASLEKIQRDLSDLEVRTLLSGDYDERAAVVTIRSGAGGVDAADFAQMLLRMYLRWAERNEYPTTVMDTSYAEEAAFTKLLHPLIKVLNDTANGVLHAMGITPMEEISSARSASELAALVRHSAQEGTLDTSTATLLTKSIGIGELTAIDVMTDRGRMVYLGESASAADVVELA